VGEEGEEALAEVGIQAQVLAELAKGGNQTAGEMAEVAEVAELAQVGSTCHEDSKV